MRRNQVLLDVLLLSLVIPGGLTIACFKCVSINKNNTACEDAYPRLLEQDCHYGHFAGDHCITMNGTKEDGTRILVRDCSDADWGNNCGDIRYMQKIRGCLTTCDFDGCNTRTLNTASRHSSTTVVLVLPLMLLLWGNIP